MMSPRQSNHRFLFFVLCLAHITISFNLSAIAAVVPAISREFGVSDFATARLISYYLWAYGLGALLYAPLTQWFSVRRLLLCSVLLFTLSCLYCAWARSLTVLWIASMINGCAASSVVPLGLMTIGSIFDKHERGRAVGAFFSVSFISSLLGIALSAFVTWNFLFIIPALLGSITMLSMLFCDSKQFALPRRRNINYLKALRHSNIFKVFTFIFLMSFLYHGIHKWYGVYLDQEYRYSQSLISFMILMTSISGVCGQMLGGVLTDRVSRLKSIQLGLIVLGVSTLFLMGKYSAGILAILLGLISIGWTIGHNGISTVLTDFSDDFRPEIAGLNSSVRFIGGAMGFFVSGLLIKHSFLLNFSVIGGILLIMVPLTKYLLSNYGDQAIKGKGLEC